MGLSRRCCTRAPSVLWLLLGALAAAAGEPTLSDERVVFQTHHGDIEFGFYPLVAPVTAQHIFRLCQLGMYIDNHIFRVDKNFVAQVADVITGRDAHPNEMQDTEAQKTLPLEVSKEVVHVPGVLSMGRYDDPHSGTSSFSFLLGEAKHLDMAYTIFGRVTGGMETLDRLQRLETKREGIFVMPLERVTIQSTYWYYASSPGGIVLGALNSGGAVAGKEGREDDAAKAGHTQGLVSKYCNHLQDELDQLQARFNWQAEELHRVRVKCLPGN